MLTQLILKSKIDSKILETLRGKVFLYPGFLVGSKRMNLVCGMGIIPKSGIAKKTKIDVSFGFDVKYLSMHKYYDSYLFFFSTPITSELEPSVNLGLKSFVMEKGTLTFYFFGGSPVDPRLFNLDEWDSRHELVSNHELFDPNIGDLNPLLHVINLTPEAVLDRDKRRAIVTAINFDFPRKKIHDDEKYCLTLEEREKKRIVQAWKTKKEHLDIGNWERHYVKALRRAISQMRSLLKKDIDLLPTMDTISWYAVSPSLSPLKGFCRCMGKIAPTQTHKFQPKLRVRKIGMECVLTTPFKIDKNQMSSIANYLSESGIQTKVIWYKGLRVRFRIDVKLPDLDYLVIPTVVKNILKQFKERLNNFSQIKFSISNFWDLCSRTEMWIKELEVVVHTPPDIAFEEELKKAIVTSWSRKLIKSLTKTTSKDVVEIIVRYEQNIKIHQFCKSFLQSCSNFFINLGKPATWIWGVEG